MLDDWLKIIASFLSGIIAIYIRELIVQFMKKRREIKKSFELACISIYDELQNNFYEYSRQSEGGGISLQNLFEVNGTGIDFFESDSINRFNRKFDNSSWIAVKTKLVEINFNLSKEISEIYYVFEYLILQTKKDTILGEFDLSLFIGFSKKYNSLIEKISCGRQ